MSGLVGVHVLLLVSSLASGALIISDNEAATETRSAAKLLQKRSTNENTVEVHSVTVQCTVMSRFAHTVMTSVALNKANSSQEIFYEVEMPKTAFITNFSMEIEGKEYIGEVKEKEKAKKQYEKAISSGQTAGLVQASGRKMEKFSVSVNIAAESNVTFILTYEELLQRKLGRYEIFTRIKPKTVVQQFQILANIYEPQGLSYVDAHATFLSNELLPLVEKTITDTKGFYEEVANPLLLEVDLQYPDNTVESVTTNHFSQLFNGSEIVVAGRLIDNDLDNFLVEVLGQGFEEDFREQGQAAVVDWGVLYPDESYIFGDFTERLWAYLTIQQLLEKSKSGGSDEKVNATAKALEMSLQYSFVTPLTSMVVTKPETEDGTESPLIADKLTEEQRQQAEKYKPVARYMGSSYQNLPTMHYARTPSYYVDGDPHFMIELPEKDDALCFNINDQPGTIFNLVRDPESGILVNGEVVGDKMIPPDGKISTYFWKFGIVHQTLGVKLEVTTQDISVYQDSNKVELLWTDTASLKGLNMDLLVTKDRSLTVTLKDSVKFVILLHKVWKKHPYHRDYLGFYTLDTHLLSPEVHGLLGQFYHGIDYEVTELRLGETPEKPDATMYVKGHELNVTRGWQRDFREDVKNGENVPCWFIHNNGYGLVDGDARDYIVTSLFTTV
ncbi:inter-alpha-trypsin inhibitor heavy chain H3 [Nematolebias whitei]|uniref:inter-alpha-trypsin inhibitor heavy chain H3 n=1 Tax=Nematolebias whitei TaxID=451745 RepID=UPI001898C9A1|nr:inter-alpha-trypsin inhibitor heavy chain H3 [Nematolebias whitei]